jgi:hypothetical protein
LLFAVKMYSLDFSWFFMMPPVLILGLTKSMQASEIKRVFNFYKSIGNPMTQCFAFIRMPNYIYRGFLNTL